MASSSFLASTESQKRWRLHMNLIYSTKSPGILPCVFQVPDALKDTKPEAYIPQLLGLGPYHHFRPQLQHMSIKKREAVYHILETVKSSNDNGESAIRTYEDFIRSMESRSSELHCMISWCYDRFVDLDHQTLSWIVVVDSMVLWHLIISSSEEDEKFASDVFMLENQIPNIIIAETRRVLGLTCDLRSDLELPEKFFHFCARNSPFRLTIDPDVKQAAFESSNHILDFMYQLIMGSINVEVHSGPYYPITRPPLWRYALDQFKVGVGVSSDHASEIFHHLVHIFCSATERAKASGRQVAGKLEKISKILQARQQYCSCDQIKIPSVSRLRAILDVRFKPLPRDNHGIRNTRLAKREDGTTSFDLYLPVIDMGPDSEVIFRNLVAYEATMSSRQTWLLDFVALLCGLVKAEIDVQLLKDAGILKVNGQLQNNQILGICRRIKMSDERPPGYDSKFRSIVEDASDEFNKTTFVRFWRATTKAFLCMVTIYIGLFISHISLCRVVDCQAEFNHSFDGPEAKALVLTRKLFLY